MSHPGTEERVPARIDVDAPPANTVAMIGLIMTGVAALMCGILFAAARALPDPVPDSQLQDTPPPVNSTRADAENSDAPDSPATAEEQADQAAKAAEEAELARQQQEARDAQVLRVLLLASTTAVLNLVGLVLSLAGLFVPNRPRAMAACGVALSLLLFAGIFGVMAVGAFLNPATISLVP